MKETRIFVRWVVFCTVCSSSLSAVEFGFTSDYFTDTIYSFDVQSGLHTPILTLAGGIDFVDLQLLDRDTLYILGFNDKNLYALDLNTNISRLVTSSPICGPSDTVYSIGLADTKTAYVVGFNQNNIYAVDLENGSSSTFLSLSGNPGLTNIVMRNPTLGYVSGYFDNHLYEVDFAQSTYRQVTPMPVGFPGIPAIEGLALAGVNTAYVVGNADGNMYEVDLTTGGSSLITPMPIGGGGGSGVFLINLAVDEGFGYTVNNVGEEIYKIELENGNYQILTNISGTNLTGMALLPAAIIPVPPAPPPTPPPSPPDILPIYSKIVLVDLKQNNLHLANYLNENAPEDVIRLFSELSNGLDSALERTAPTRNACVTYTSQMGSLAFSRVIHDHERQKSFQHRIRRKGEEISFLADSGALVADAKDRFTPIKTQCYPEKSHTVWVAPFGGYTKLHAQHQTPSFNMGLGGLTAAWDYNGVNHNLFGIAAAYLYTNVQEKQQMGHGHVEQGLLGFYGTRTMKNWTFDLGIMGGYYRGHSVRKIEFSGVKETATSHPQGYQVIPSIEFGYHRFAFDRCESPRCGVAPFLLVDWVANWEHKLKERGAAPFNMGQKSRFSSLLHAEAGLRCHETIKWKKGTVVVREKFAYSYQRAYQAGSIQAFLVGSPGHFSLQTLSAAQNLGIAELSIFVLADRPKVPYLDLWYEGQFGVGYQLHQVTLELGKNF